MIRLVGWLRKLVGRFMLHVPVDSMELGELPALEERVEMLESRLDALLAVTEGFYQKRDHDPESMPGSGRRDRAS